MNYEVWLKTNRRACWILGFAPASVAVACAAVGLCSPAAWLYGASVAALGCSVVAVAWTIRCGRLPRLAFLDQQLLVYLSGPRPIAVPIDIVECFFLGQGASFLPRAVEGPHREAAEASTIVVRLAEAARDWSHRDVRPSLGQWCEGYITIRGTWCEPISQELVGGLNQKLVAAHRVLRRGSEVTVSAP